MTTEEKRQRWRADYLRRRDKILAQKKIYHALHRDRQKAYHREWHLRNRDAHNAEKRRWYRDNREHALEQKRVYHQQNRDAIRESKRRQRAERPERTRLLRQAEYRRNIKQRKAYLSRPEIAAKVSDYNKQWWQQHPGHRRLMYQRWISENREHKREYGTIYRVLNAEKVKEKNRAWKQANPHKCRANEIARKARLLNAIVGDIKEVQKFYRDIRQAESVSCFWCEKVIPKNERTVDHYISLNRGGKHAVDNLVPACLHCNCSKRDMPPEEFRKLQNHATTHAVTTGPVLRYA